jgi:hypothetical protein
MHLRLQRKCVNPPASTILGNCSASVLSRKEVRRVVTAAANFMILYVSSKFLCKTAAMQRACAQWKQRSNDAAITITYIPFQPVAAGLLV